MMSANQNANAAQFLLKSKNHSEKRIKTGSTIFPPACFGMSCQRLFPCFFMMSANQNANAARLLLKSKKQQESSRKPHKKQAARFFRLPAFDMFEPSEAFSMLLFVIPANQNANAAPLRLKGKKQQKPFRKLHKNRQHVLSPVCFGIFEPSKAFSMLLFMIPANHATSHCNQNQNANNQRHHLPIAFP